MEKKRYNRTQYRCAHYYSVECSKCKKEAEIVAGFGSEKYNCFASIVCIKKGMIESLCIR